VNLDFVCTGPSHMHGCRAFLFALAGLFLFIYEVTNLTETETAADDDHVTLFLIWTSTCRQLPDHAITHTINMATEQNFT